MNWPFQSCSGLFTVMVVDDFISLARLKLTKVELKIFFLIIVLRTADFLDVSWKTENFPIKNCWSLLMLVSGIHQETGSSAESFWVLSYFFYKIVAWMPPCDTAREKHPNSYFQYDVMLIVCRSTHQQKIAFIETITENDKFFSVSMQYDGGNVRICCRNDIKRLSCIPPIKLMTNTPCSPKNGQQGCLSRSGYCLGIVPHIWWWWCWGKCQQWEFTFSVLQNCQASFNCSKLIIHYVGSKM